MRVPRHAAWSAAAFLVFSIQALADATHRPAAPQVTLGADLKLLRFDWEPVPGANFYRLWIKTGDSPYTSVGPRIPAAITQAQHSIAVHLQDWVRTRYVVTACNSAGCAASAPLNPQRLMLETIGYLKASNTDPGDFFGSSVTLSDDGHTLAVTAQNESSGASGVNGDQEDNSFGNSGAVYIFRRSGSRWRQEAYLKSPVNRPGIQFGASTALSRDGLIAVIGAPAQDAGGFGFAGEVYVFRRGSSGWSLSATLRAPEPQSADFFGVSVELSLDGRTLKVSSRQPQDIDVNHEGRTHIFDRVGSTWQHKVTLAPFHAGDFCPVVRMSGDGRTLVASCYSLAGVYRAVTFKRVGDTWMHAADLELTRFASERPLALNFDGTTMALTLLQLPSYGSVGVYRWEGSTWVQEAHIFRPDVLFPSVAFGFTLAFDRDGNRLAIGDFVSTAGGAGVSRTVESGNAEHGAVFLYQRNDALTSPWQLRSRVKAPNPGTDLYGISVALSGSGRTLAVGAIREESSARGIDGDQTDESAPDAGAAYLY